MLPHIGASASTAKIILPMPIPLMKTAALLLDWLPFFPVTRDQLTMLAEGNAASDSPLTELIGKPPRKFDAKSLSYLSERH